MKTEALPRVLERPLADQWGDDEEMLLAEYIAVFYPRGPLKVASLRTEIRKGQLIYARFAGKLFVTPANVRQAFQRSSACPVPAKAPASTSEKAESTGAPVGRSPMSGASSMERARLAQASLLTALDKLSPPSPRTSPKSTRRRPLLHPPQAEVIQIRS